MRATASGIVGAAAVGYAAHLLLLRWRNIQDGGAVEETLRAQLEPDGVDRHDRPVFRAREVRQAERVPHDVALPVDVAVGYAALSARVRTAGAFYAYVARGLGRVTGVSAAWVALLTFSMAAFMGLESGSVYVEGVKDPENTVRRALRRNLGGVVALGSP